MLKLKLAEHSQIGILGGWYFLIVDETWLLIFLDGRNLRSCRFLKDFLEELVLTSWNDHSSMLKLQSNTSSLGHGGN